MFPEMDKTTELCLQLQPHRENTQPVTAETYNEVVKIIYLL